MHCQTVSVYLPFSGMPWPLLGLHRISLHTVSLHASLLSWEVADGYKQVGLTPERFNKAFHATMETIASESQANDGSNITSRLVASVWKVHLDVQLDDQYKELAAATAVLMNHPCKWLMRALILMLLLHLHMQLKVLLLLLSNLLQALLLLLLSKVFLTHVLT